MYEEGGFSAEDRPALEKNYEEWLGGYLQRPFAQRLDTTEGSDFYTILNDVSQILTKSANPDKYPLEDWTQEDLGKQQWMEGLFGGEVGRGSRDKLVKLGLTHGGTGYYSSLIHQQAQNQMNYYRNIGWTEDRIFKHMTEGMNKPQAGSEFQLPAHTLEEQPYGTSPIASTVNPATSVGKGALKVMALPNFDYEQIPEGYVRMGTGEIVTLDELRRRIAPPKTGVEKWKEEFEDVLSGLKW